MAFNILIVDDSQTVRAVVRKVLSLAGVEVNDLYEAANGQEALDILSSSWVDLVLADINMPVMNGIEMVEKMAADNLLQTVPVIIVSTEGSKTRIEELKGKGVKGYIRKPFTPEMLREIIDQVLEPKND